MTSISGYDAGELVSAPLDAVEAEYRRFALPIEWLIDAVRCQTPAILCFGNGPPGLTRTE